jgi:hypothetical protein
MKTNITGVNKKKQWEIDGVQAAAFDFDFEKFFEIIIQFFLRWCVMCWNLSKTE